MKNPIPFLEEELSTLRVIASGNSPNKKEAGELIPAFENTIKLLNKANGAGKRKKQCHKHIVNRWAYLFDNWQPIMLGVTIALAFNVIVTMFENVIVKIALIIHGS